MVYESVFDRSVINGGPDVYGLSAIDFGMNKQLQWRRVRDAIRKRLVGLMVNRLLGAATSCGHDTNNDSLTSHMSAFTLETPKPRAVKSGDVPPIWV